jgi:hypothetical protein
MLHNFYIGSDTTECKFITFKSDTQDGFVINGTVKLGFEVVKFSRPR